MSTESNASKVEQASQVTQQLEHLGLATKSLSDIVSTLRDKLSNISFDKKVDSSGENKVATDTESLCDIATSIRENGNDIYCAVRQLGDIVNRLEN